MSLYRDSKLKIRSTLKTIDTLSDGDFPSGGGGHALQRLRRVFKDLNTKLDRSHRLNDAAMEAAIAENVNLKIYQSLPILGFILRSTNVRNAFEFLEPLLDIANSTLKGAPQLLLSSEWDYVPFAYPQSLEELRNFVLIGMPASEAGNSLVIPLAGHELGHAVWRNRSLEGSVHATIQYRCSDLYQTHMEEFRGHFREYDPLDIVNKEALPEAIGHSVEFAMFQAEELFCDLFAYGLFGQSYSYAFAYILAPGSTQSQGHRYPAKRVRIELLRRIAQSEGVTMPGPAALKIADEKPIGDPQMRFMLRMASESVSLLQDALWGNVCQILSEKDVRRPSTAQTVKHVAEFRLGIPATEPTSLGDIINAGWAFYNELKSSRQDEDAIYLEFEHLNEMVLKSVEVLEFRHRVQDVA